MTAPAFRIIGHRGIAGLAPENTLAGFRRAASLGVRWVEFDVHLSADGVPLLLHDDTLDRTTNGKGPVARANFVALQSLDAGSWFDSGFRGEKIPSLQETVSLLGELGLGALVEIKPSPGIEKATAAATVSCLQAHWPKQASPPIVSSFNTAALAEARDKAPEIARALLLRELTRDWYAQVKELGCSAVHLGAQRLKPAAVKAVADAGLPVYAYTVNDVAKAAELSRWGVSGVFSDRPDRLMGHEFSAPAEAAPL